MVSGLHRLLGIVKKYFHIHKVVIISLFILVLFSFSLAVFATPPTSPYVPTDQILDPTCGPTDTNCFVSLLDLQTNSVDNANQSKLNLIAGGNISLVSDSSGGLTIDASLAPATIFTDGTLTGDGSVLNPLSVVSDPPVLAVSYATTGPLPKAPTYNNNGSGIGATLTASTNGAIPPIDGITPAVSDEVLVKDQVADLQNGIYVVTAIGDGSHPYILTRAADSDETSELDSQIVSVALGTTNRGKLFAQTTDEPVVGTDPIDYVQTRGVSVTQKAAGTQTLGQIPYWTGIAKQLSKGSSDLTYNPTTRQTSVYSFLDGSSSQFAIDQNGNLTKINNVTYSWPTVQGATSTVLTNNGSGTLTWTAVSGGGTTTSPGGSNGDVQFDSSGTFGGSGNFFWNNSLNRLGIGTASPNFALDVSGTINAVTQYDIGGTFFAISAGTDLSVGNNAGRNAVSATDNTFIGVNSGSASTSFSTAIGGSALFDSSGTGNTALGAGAGSPVTGPTLGDNLTTGTSNTFLGAETGVSSGSLSNSVALGSGALISLNNQFALADTITDLKIRGVDYVFPSSQGATSTVLTNNGSGTLTWTVVSGGGGTTTNPGGSNGDVQFDSSGSFGGSPNFFWNNSLNGLGIGTSVPTANLTIDATGVPGLSYTEDTGGISSLTFGQTYSGFPAGNSGEYEIKIDSNGTPEQTFQDSDFQTPPSITPIDDSGSLSDATFGGSYSGSASTPVYFMLTIDSEGTPDTFAWTEYNSSLAVVHSATHVAITGSTQTLADGITVQFGDTTGHTSGGDWWAYVIPTPSVDSFQWAYTDSSGTVQNFFVPITGSNQSLNHGETARFGSTTGHSIGDDGTETVSVRTAPDLILAQDTHSHSYLDIDPSNGLYALGDINSANDGTYFSINDSAQRYTFSQANFSIATVPYVFPGSQGASNTVLTNDGSGNLSWNSNVGGADTDVQFNEGGTLAGDNDFTWDNGTKTLQASDFGNQEFLDDPNNEVVALGVLAGVGETSALTNFIGDGAGFNSAFSINSNFFGTSAGSGAGNSPTSNFIGDAAGENATSSSLSNFIGDSAGVGGSSSVADNFIGAGAGQGATSTTNSNFIGDFAGFSASGSNESNFIGYQAGQQFSFSSGNPSDSNFIGTGAGMEAAKANESNFIGDGAGQGATNSQNSNFIGTSAGFQSPSAAHSIFIGYQAGLADTVNNTVSGSSILIGDNTNTGGHSNSIALGAGATDSTSNQLVIGSTSTPINSTFIVGTGSTQCTITTGTGISCSSDERLKQNITDLPNDTLDTLTKVRTVTYNWINGPTTNQQVGFIAQDLLQYFPDLVSIDPNGYYSVYYAQMTPILTEAIRELDLKVEPLTSLDTTVNGSLGSLIAQFLENEENGLTSVHTKELCLDDVCVTKDQLQQILQQENIQSAPDNSTSTDSSSTGDDSTSTSDSSSSTDSSGTLDSSTTDSSSSFDSSSTTTDASSSDASSSSTDSSSTVGNSSATDTSSTPGTDATSTNNSNSSSNSSSSSANSTSSDSTSS